ncbi:MAG: type VI secretion system baseplate subunit TssF [Gammaproteobacteria bacterium]|nr:type VI secretion system baseplate subunit TssF [Gammaproteobacteria bacterium]MBI5615183.1 type VI secretion system baseplate subunit TssF [Gammaproteobacteria bacterium]
MDPRLLKYYNRELQFVREVGSEFAAEFPKIASRLSLDGFECADPYVERLLEGFAFLAARVQLKFDSEYPRFTEHLLQTVYPHYLSPQPSMAVVHFQADTAEPNLAQGFSIPRDTVLRAGIAAGEQTSCEYRTGHDVKLWPLTIADASYVATGGDLGAIGVTDTRGARAGLRLSFSVTANLTADKLALDCLNLFLPGSSQTPARVHEQLLANAIGFVIRPATRPAPWQEFLPASAIRQPGLTADEALLPHGPRSFSGYRLLAEYFAFPNRFLFVEFTGLKRALARCTESAFELVVLLNRSDPELERAVQAGDFALHCTPAINLFPKRADRVHVNDRDYEFHVVPDRTRPMDYEVYAVTGVSGFDANLEQRFESFYAHHDLMPAHSAGRYYSVHRMPRVLSPQQRRYGTRSNYVGTEVYVSLVDAHEQPYSSGVRELGFDTLCTNRDLPQMMPIGSGSSDFDLVAGAPVHAVRCVAGPTKPRPAPQEGEAHWRIINHLSSNYLGLLDSDERQGATALRDMLGLYGDATQANIVKQIEGVRSITYKPINRRLPSPGPIAFGRGLEITLACEEQAFEGVGIFLLGTVLEQFFARYVSMNSFTEMVLKSTTRGEVMRWPPRLGRRQTA